MSLTRFLRKKESFTSSLKEAVRQEGSAAGGRSEALHRIQVAFIQPLAEGGYKKRGEAEYEIFSTPTAEAANSVAHAA